LKKTHIIVYLFLCLSILTLPIYRASAATATIAVDPQITNVNGGQTFGINITVSNIVNFTSWQLSLFYLRSIVNCSNAVEGPFLKTGGGTFFNANITNNYNSTHGRVLAYSTLLGMTVVNGGGQILLLTFKAMSGGTTNLTLTDVKLGDEKIPPQPIPYTVINGIVIVAGGAHDVAITNVVSLKTIIGQGYTGNVTVTAEDHGGYPETYVVTLYANATIVGIASVTQSPGDSTVVTIVLNATGLATGNYTLTAVADTVPGEATPGDNTYVLTYPAVHVGVPADISSSTPGVYDGVCNMKDIAYMVALFNTRPDSPNWNPNADVNNDGVCNMKDIAIGVAYFNKHE
jgi:hypothetical protein